MPQDGSARPAASNPAIAWLNQKEWSMATARVNSFCAAGLQEVGKFTVPSFSGSRWALAGTAKRTATETAMAKDRMVSSFYPTRVERTISRNGHASVNAHRCYEIHG